MVADKPVDLVRAFPVQQHLEELRPAEPLRRSHMAGDTVRLVDTTVFHFAALVAKQCKGMPRIGDFPA